MVKKFAMAAALALVLAPASARADWLFTPNLGMSFGGSASGNEHATYGTSIGWMGGGVFGWEADLSYTPEFFEAGDNDVDFIDDSNATTIMFNAILGAPAGGQRGKGFRPYATGGLGWIRTNVTDADDIFNTSNDDFGFNVGAGAFGFLTDHVGLRGDVRYFRSLQDHERDNNFDIDLGSLDFWRGTVGLSFRW